MRPCETPPMLDERLVKALHVESLREDELHAEREPHVLFQASTIGALLDGAYEVSGYHLHFISADRSHGGHVLEARPRRATASIDVSTDLHVELPPGVDLASTHASRQVHEALERAEHSG